MTNELETRIGVDESAMDRSMIFRDLAAMIWRRKWFLVATIQNGPKKSTVDKNGFWWPNQMVSYGGHTILYSKVTPTIIVNNPRWRSDNSLLITYARLRFLKIAKYEYHCFCTYVELSF